jgi:hypothetical protein
LRSSHLLQEVVREVLGLVDEQHHVLGGGGALQQEVVEALGESDPVVAAVGQPKLAQDRAQELDAAHHRVEDEGGGVSLAQGVDDGPAEGALARADLAGDLDEPLALGDAEQHVVHRLPVPAGQEQVPGIRRDRERLGRQAVELFVDHDVAAAAPRGARGRSLYSRPWP